VSIVALLNLNLAGKEDLGRRALFFHVNHVNTKLVIKQAPASTSEMIVGKLDGIDARLFLRRMITFIR